MLTEVLPSLNGMPISELLTRVVNGSGVGAGATVSQKKASYAIDLLNAFLLTGDASTNLGLTLDPWLEPSDIDRIITAMKVKGGD